MPNKDSDDSVLQKSSHYNAKEIELENTNRSMREQNANDSSILMKKVKATPDKKTSSKNPKVFADEDELMLEPHSN